MGQTYGPGYLLVLRRMTWAKKSFGATAHTDYHDGVQSDYWQIDANQNVVRKHGISSMRTYVDKFDSTMSINVGGATRLIPRVIQSEVDECLPADEALGHFMYTVGYGDDQ